ncbi:MAG: hypothetical protein GYA77_03325 [Candidatus Cloacimonetes bacterium]|nr:hypothetical protein [Candidatus Cloacimonadota bacterium]
MDDKVKYVVVIFLALLVTFVMSYSLRPVYLIIRMSLINSDLFWLPDVIMVLGILGLFVLSVFMILGFFKLLTGESHRSGRGIYYPGRKSTKQMLANSFLKLWPVLVLLIMIALFFSYDYLMSLVPKAAPLNEKYPVLPQNIANTKDSSYTTRADSLKL